MVGYLPLSHLSRTSTSLSVGGALCVVCTPWGLDRGFVFKNIRASSWWAPAQGPYGVNTLPGTMLASFARVANVEEEDRSELLTPLVKGFPTPRTRSNIWHTAWEESRGLWLLVIGGGKTDTITRTHNTANTRVCFFFCLAQGKPEWVVVKSLTGSFDNRR